MNNETKPTKNFTENQEIIMTLPSGWSMTYWFHKTDPTDPNFAICKTIKGGKYHQRVHYDLLKAA